MRIVVCIKQINMIYARTGRDPQRHYLSPEDMIARVNPCDETALETALRIKDQQSDAEIILLTLGPLMAEKDLRRCLAMGADTIYHIDEKEGADPRWKALLLAHAIRDLDVDLIFCGKESLDKRNGQVPAFIAHHLGFPHVSAIMEIAVQNSHAIIKRSAGKGIREKIECPLPAVFSVDLGSCNPRLPAYKERQKALSDSIQKLEYSIETPLNRIISLAVFPPRPRPKMIPAPDTNFEAFDRIQQLLAGSLVEKKGIILRGSLESQVDGIITFLETNGFLPLVENKERKAKNDH
jgi:electron transfer flavoprotein beta subunit